MFQPLIQKILEHDSYGPAMAEAVEKKAPLVLDYHNHGPDSGYCVSICEPSPLALELGRPGSADSGLRELVHIRGFGQTEEQCVPLSGAFGKALEEHYGLDHPPEIYLNGKPLTGDGSSQDGGTRARS